MRQAFRWWEVDATYYVLKALSWLGVVWDLKSPPEAVLRNEQRLGSRVINRTAARLAARFDAEGIATALKSSLQVHELLALSEVIAKARDGATDALAGMHLPHLPSRDEVLKYARAMLASSPSFEEIVDRAYELLLASVGTHLAVPARQSA